MNFKFLVPVFLFLLIVGCTGGDIKGFVQQLPDVKSFLADYPNADIKVSLLDEATVRDRINQLEDSCGFPPPIQEYYFVTVEDPPETIYILLTKNQEVQCLVRFGPGSGNPNPDPSSTTNTATAGTGTTTTGSGTTVTGSGTTTGSGTNTNTSSSGTVSISGIVKDLQGNPVEGMVFLVKLDGTDWDHTFAQTEINEQGYYELL